MLNFRTAGLDDLPGIIALLADDAIGAARESTSPERYADYLNAWHAIHAQSGNSIQIASLEGEVAGVLQLTLIPGLARGGMLRGQIEGVRVSGRHRGSGIGRQLLRHAIDLAQAAGCGLVQLTTDKRREDARRFYAELGFVASHEGMKLMLAPPASSSPGS